ncbi:MAG: NAD-dependent epimerase/dehydratase family protein [Patescibacteria group bacterium]|jgi:UDP-glucuronate decarboxylase
MTETPIFDQENVLVSGGAGFIGSHLCDELVKKYKVICIDNFITGQERNIDHLLDHPNFEFVRHDINEPIDLAKYPGLKKFKVEFQGIQQIFNLACPTSPKEYNRIPIETLLTNSHGTRNMLELAVKYKAKFLHVSSSSVYGEPLENAPFQEDYWGFINPVGPRSCYNEGKRFAESMVTNYKRAYELETKILRVFNTFGPRMRMDDGRMIPDFVVSAIENRDIEIYGDENANSTFCYINDLIEAITRAMKASFTGILNIGNPEEHRIVDIASEIINITGSSSKVVYKEALPFTSKQGVPDITLAKAKLGWFPVVPLSSGLKETIEYMRGSSHILNFNPNKP